METLKKVFLPAFILWALVGVGCMGRGGLAHEDFYQDSERDWIDNDLLYHTFCSFSINFRGSELSGPWWAVDARLTIAS